MRCVSTYSRKVIEIAEYIFANPTVKRRDVLAKFGKKWQTPTRTLDRIWKEAKEYKVPSKSKENRQHKEEQKSEENKPTIGRPTSYKKEFCEQVFKLCLLGATDKAIADFFNIAESTLNNWKLEYPDFLESIKRGKEEADANVGASLYSRAIGHKKKDCEKVFNYQGKIVRANVTEYWPPDTTAAIFWLKNRQPELWRDKQVQEIEAGGFLSFLMQTNTVSNDTGTGNRKD